MEDRQGSVCVTVLASDLELVYGGPLSVEALGWSQRKRKKKELAVVAGVVFSG